MQEGRVVRGEPGEAEAGQAIGFADGAETDGAVVEITGGGKTVSGVVFEFAIDLVGEDVEVVAGGEFENVAEDFGAHKEASGIVGRVDIESPGVGTDEQFESGEIVGPIVFGLAAPLADGGTGGFGERESAFVAGRFDDGVIGGREKRVIEEEDGFFGGRDDDEIAGLDGGVDGGEGFAEPGGAGRFGVAAPVPEEGIVGAGFEGEEIGDGDGFGVGGGEEILGREFVEAHVFLDAEGCDLHGNSLRV